MTLRRVCSCRVSGSSRLGAPMSGSQPVEDVPLHRVAVRHARVIEIVRRIMSHPELPHDRLRAHVADCGHRDDLGQADLLEAVLDRLVSRLGGIAPAPDVLGEPVADLERGRERCFERLVDEPGEADEPTRRQLLPPRPNPRPVRSASIRSTNASLSSRVIGATKNSITSRSAFIRANGARSSGHQRRSNSRSVLSTRTSCQTPRHVTGDPDRRGPWPRRSAADRESGAIPVRWSFHTGNSCYSFQHGNWILPAAGAR